MDPRLRARIRERVEALGIPVFIPPTALCTDNAAMIAAAAHFRFEAGARSPLDLDIFPVLPIA